MKKRMKTSLMTRISIISWTPQFEEEEHDHEELVSSLTALGTGVLAFGEMVEGMDRVFQTIDDILEGVDSILDDWLS